MFGKICYHFENGGRYGTFYGPPVPKIHPKREFQGNETPRADKDARSVRYNVILPNLPDEQLHSDCF
jgi:hypothetical protein